jgi:hypothetical protein
MQLEQRLQVCYCTILIREIDLGIQLTPKKSVSDVLGLDTV